MKNRFVSFVSSYVIIEIPFYLGVKGRKRKKKRPDDIN